MFKSSLREFYGRRYCLDNRYGISVTNDHVVYTFFLFLLVILFSVCRFTHSDYPFGIFKLFLSVLRFTNPDYPFGIFELSFLSICRYQNVLKLRRKFVANRKLRSIKNIKILKRLWGKLYVIFITMCMERDPFPQCRIQDI